MPKPLRGAPLGALIGLVSVLLLLTLAVERSRTAIERANRMYRSDNPRGAADIYGVHVDTTGAGAQASYNLGTALMQFETVQAERYLIRATEGSDSAAAQRAHYNLGYRLLTGVEPNGDPFSAIPLLSGAIDHNRAALRLDPGDQDARWNLALALRAYGEVPEVFEEGPAETGETEVDTPEEESGRAEAEADGAGPSEEFEEAPPSPNPSNPEGLMIGVREAPARGDPGPLTAEMAARLLEEGLSDDTRLMVRGLLWSQRPEVVRGGEPSPGGSW